MFPNIEIDHFYYPEFLYNIVASYDTLPEAIVCGNDMIAKRLTESFRKIGVRVPEDVALTGFDDDEDRMLYPFFSTVHVDTKWLGRRMVHEFLWREEPPEAPKERIFVSKKESQGRPGGREEKPSAGAFPAPFLR